MNMRFDRRSVLAMALAAGLAAPTSQARSSWRPVFGAQLYPLQNAAAKDLATLLTRLAAAGFQSVEFAGFYSYEPAQIKEALNQAGLKAVGAHCLPLSISDDAAKRAMEMCANISIPRAITALLSKKPDSAGRFPPISSVFAGLSEDDVRWSADRMNHLAMMARGYGLQYAYHTHNVDFAPVGGATVLDQLMRHTDPSLVFLQLDIGNAVAAGADPLFWLRSQAPRLCAVHVKEWSPGFSPSYALHFPRPASFGAGVTNWNAILKAVKRLGLTDVIIEQEADPAKDPFTAQSQALDFLKKSLKEI